MWRSKIVSVRAKFILGGILGGLLGGFLIGAPPVLARSDGSFPGKGSYNAWVNANQLLKFGNECAERGDFDRALDYYKKAINTYDFDSIYYFNVGNAFSRKANYPIAEESYRKATELEPDYFQAWLNLGHAIARQGRYLEAAKTLKRAAKLSQNPDEKAEIQKTIVQFENMPGQVSPQAPGKESKKKKNKKKQQEQDAVPDSTTLPGAFPQP